MKKSDASKIVGLMIAIWPAREITEATIEVYADSFLDLEAVALMAAVEQLKTTSKFFPSIAELREIAVAAQAPGSGVPTFDMALHEVRRTIGSRGRTALMPGESPLQWSHPAIKAAVDAMGWKQICDSENEEASRAHFRQLYESASKREQIAAVETPRAKQLRAQLQELGASGIAKQLPA